MASILSITSLAIAARHCKSTAMVPQDWSNDNVWSHVMKERAMHLLALEQELFDQEQQADAKWSRSLTTTSLACVMCIKIMNQISAC